MSGIAGWIDFERDLTQETHIVSRMTETMAHRGPDGSGLWSSMHAVLGHRRLALIDEPGGAQPMVAPDIPVVLTLSGEIHNFAELRIVLEGHGHRFRTRSDTEVLLRAYVQWGEACLSRLNGSFAFAIWDVRKQSLLLVRDRLGVKPLYYLRTTGGVVFGSEPKALFASGQYTPTLNTEGMAALFAEPGTRPPGRTVLCDLSEVRPGAAVRVNEGGAQEFRYWRLEPKEHTDNRDNTIGTVRSLLEDAVRMHMLGDVPVGVLLSGGVDSSTLTALAAGALRANGGDQIHTYSVDFHGHEVDFEPEAARPSRDQPFVELMVKRVGAQHTSILLDVPDLLVAEGAALSAADLPDPSGNMATSMYLLFNHLRKFCTIALSGESADEIFGGYHWYKDGSPYLDGFPWNLDGAQLDKLLRDDVQAEVKLPEYVAQCYFDGRAEIPELDGEPAEQRRMRESIHLGITHWLPFILDRKDRMSMASALEVRLPFCDHRVVEYLYSVPWELKSVDGMEKGLLRSAVSDLVPHEVAWRPKSMYPAVRNPEYECRIRARTSALLEQSDAPIFAMVDPAKLADALANPTSVGGLWKVPGPLTWAAYLIRINDWLTRYSVRVS